MGVDVLVDWVWVVLGIDFYEIMLDGWLMLELVFCLGLCVCVFLV